MNSPNLISTIIQRLPSYPSDQHFRVEVYTNPTVVEAYRGFDRIYMENFTTEEYLFTVNYIKFLSSTVNLSEPILDKLQ